MTYFGISPSLKHTIMVLLSIVPSSTMLLFLKFSPLLTSFIYVAKINFSKCPVIGKISSKKSSVLYPNCKVRNRKCTSLNILLKVPNEIHHEMILSLLTGENLSTYLLKGDNKKNVPQQLISKWTAVYLLSSLMRRGISPVGCVTMGVEI